jgi:hypothetical protein
MVRLYWQTRVDWLTSMAREVLQVPFKLLYGLLSYPLRVLYLGLYTHTHMLEMTHSLTPAGKLVWAISHTVDIGAA